MKNWLKFCGIANTEHPERHAEWERIVRMSRRNYLRGYLRGMAETILDYRDDLPEIVHDLARAGGIPGVYRCGLRQVCLS